MINLQSEVMYNLDLVIYRNVGRVNHKIVLVGNLKMFTIIQFFIMILYLQ